MRRPNRNPVVTAARRVVEIIGSDPAKVETYCAIGKLGVQIEDANEAKDKKTADVLTQKTRALATRSRISLIDVRSSGD